MVEDREQHEALLPHDEHVEVAPDAAKNKQEKREVKAKWSRLVAAILVAVFATVTLYRIVFASNAAVEVCDSVKDGYQCYTEISRHWGQYSPYFSVPSKIPATVPDGCTVTVVQGLARHGARDPTKSKTVVYNDMITKLQTNVAKFTGKYAFLNDYKYNLGADQLTTFGQQQMVNLGIQFFNRYFDLASNATPFIRAASEPRVVQSAQNFTQGYHLAGLDSSSPSSRRLLPYPILVLPEASGFNNTLDHGRCTAFETDPYFSDLPDTAQATFAATFIPALSARLAHDLPTANLSTSDILSLISLCPFATVAQPAGTPLSPFCALFTPTDFQAYGYYQSLGKYYGFGPGNPLGPTQGVGFVNELIARLTRTAVHDRTSTNSTLDDDPTTFPLDATLYADFSHDNDMMAVFAAMGLYNATAALDNSTISAPEGEAAAGYAAAWAVPFAARMYVEKMECAVGDEGGQGGSGSKEEFVRVVVNDRVMPLEGCGADADGKCRLDRWVESMSFATGGGHWDQCFVGS